MTRKEARALLGNQPKFALRNMARALQSLTRLNNAEDWRRLEALRSLGYKVTIEIPGGAKEARAGRSADINARYDRAEAKIKAALRAYPLTPVPDPDPLRAAGHACAAEYIARHGLPEAKS